MSSAEIGGVVAVFIAILVIVIFSRQQKRSKEDIAGQDQNEP